MTVEATTTTTSTNEQRQADLRAWSARGGRATKVMHARRRLEALAPLTDAERDALLGAIETAHR